MQKSALSILVENNNFYIDEIWVYPVYILHVVKTKYQETPYNKTQVIIIMKSNWR